MGIRSPAIRWKKLVIRNLPHDISCAEALTLCGFPTKPEDIVKTIPVGQKAKDKQNKALTPFFFRWEAGKPAKHGRQAIPSRLHLQFRKDPELLQSTLEALNGKEIVTANNVTCILDVDLASNQKLPREKRRDKKNNTITRDQDFIAFLQQLNAPKLPPTQEEKKLNANGLPSEEEKPVSALVKFLNERRSGRREKATKVSILFTSFQML